MQEYVHQMRRRVDEDTIREINANKDFTKFEYTQKTEGTVTERKVFEDMWDAINYYEESINKEMEPWIKISKENRGTKSIEGELTEAIEMYKGYKMIPRNGYIEVLDDEDKFVGNYDSVEEARAELEEMLEAIEREDEEISNILTKNNDSDQNDDKEEEVTEESLIESIAKSMFRI